MAHAQQVAHSATFFCYPEVSYAITQRENHLCLAQNYYWKLK